MRLDDCNEYKVHQMRIRGLQELRQMSVKWLPLLLPSSPLPWLAMQVSLFLVSALVVLTKMRMLAG
jgi:hypothetical protein